MPKQNNDLATRVWGRYTYTRDNGHTDFVEKADRCDAYFRGEQWSSEDLQRLRIVRRPAMTINKILSTMSNVMGEQIYNRSETAYRPRSDTSAAQAAMMTKVYKQISDNNQLAWKRSDMFADGIITSRGFLDVRMEFDDSMTGEVRIENVNPKNVLVDPDADQYDPDTWNDVFTTKWVTADDIALLYSPEIAEQLRGRSDSYFPYGYDSIDWVRDRFGDRMRNFYEGAYDDGTVDRCIRLIERQYRELDRQKHFVFMETGDTRPIPKEFDRNKIAFFVEKFGLQVTTKLVKRIKWVAIADNFELHNEWSPYKHFTLVPYFPYFRYGHTVGLVENLLNPQDVLNKVTSQELHVVNTTANSGYKVREGALANMTVEELEQKGAQTGLVISVNGDPEKDVVKMVPNQVPTGLDRVSFKAEESIKTISGVSDSQQGFDREDVAAKAIQAKRQAGTTNLVKPMDNLARTDYFLARNILDLVQEFYTEERVMTITKDEVTGETEQFTINGQTPAGEMLNDLTLGEYGIVITSVPHRETLEDSQFEQIMAMKEAGIMIPDAVVIGASRLNDKPKVIEAMAGDKNSPEAQLQMRGQEAEVSKTEGEAAAKHADAALKTAKAQTEAQGEPPDQAAAMKAEGDIAVANRKAENDMQLKLMDHQLDREIAADDAARADRQQVIDAEQAENERIQQAAQAAQQPTKAQQE